MRPTEAYTNLCNHYRRIALCTQNLALIEWDQETMARPSGMDEHAAILGEIERYKHQLATDQRIPEWLAACAGRLSDTVKQRNLLLMGEAYARATAFDADFAAHRAATFSKGQTTWAHLKGKSDWAGFLPTFREVVKVAAEEAKILGALKGMSPYDAMVSNYERGLTMADIQPIFDNVQSWLPGLTQQIIARQQRWNIRPQGDVTVPRQRRFNRQAMRLLRINMNAVRLDESAHPFSTGSADEARITTRYTKGDWLRGYLGVVHETGHAKYQLGVPKAFRGLPIGELEGMTRHESQSLFLEMQVARGTFMNFIAPRAQRVLAPSGDPAAWTAENMYRMATLVEPGFIRVDADEVTYPLHIILRTALEPQLLDGSLDPADLPEAWNSLFKKLTGLQVPEANKGCMQDVHWPSGGFGYFPHYSLGAMMAAQLMATLRKQVPDVDAQLGRGDLRAVERFLIANIRNNASLYDVQDLLTKVTGESLNPAYLKAHLEGRYLHERW